MNATISTKTGFPCKGGDFFAEVATEESKAQDRIAHRTERHQTAEQAHEAAKTWAEANGHTVA